MDELEQEIKILSQFDDTTILKFLHEEDVKEIERLKNDFASLKLLQHKHLEEIERLTKELKEKEAILGGIQQLEAEIKRLNNIINETEKEIDRLLERQYESERFAKEHGFSTYLPAKENLLCVMNKLQKLKGGDNCGNNSFKAN